MTHSVLRLARRGSHSNWLALALVAIACGGESAHNNGASGGTGGTQACLVGAGSSCNSGGSGGSGGEPISTDGGYGGNGGFGGGPVTGGSAGCPIDDPACGCASPNFCIGTGGDGGFGGCGDFGCGGFPTTGGTTSTGGSTTASGGTPNIGFSDAGNGCSYVTYPTSWPNACQLEGSCVKLSPSPETTEGGLSAVPAQPEGGPPTERGLDAPLCDPPSPSKDYLFAFDAYSFGSSATFEITTGRAECTGATLETFSLGDFPSDLATGWRTYCVSVPGSRLESRIGVLADQPGAQTIQNIRVVSSCDCIRDVQYQTTCGMHGHGGSSGCL